MNRRQQLINEITNLVLQRLNESFDMSYDTYLKSGVDRYIDYNEDSEEYFVSLDCPPSLVYEVEKWCTALTNLETEHGKKGIESWEDGGIELKIFL